MNNLNICAISRCLISRGYALLVLNYLIQKKKLRTPLSLIQKSTSLFLCFQKTKKCLTSEVVDSFFMAARIQPPTVRVCEFYVLPSNKITFCFRMSSLINSNCFRHNCDSFGLRIFISYSICGGSSYINNSC